VLIIDSMLIRRLSMTLQPEAIPVAIQMGSPLCEDGIPSQVWVLLTIQLC